MKAKRYLGCGGLGDAFIIYLKLLEVSDKNFIYTHLVDTGEAHAKMIDKFLNDAKITHDIIIVKDIKQEWQHYVDAADKCFNVFAKGYINIPKRPYHWEPCVDSGITQPFAKDNIKHNCVVIQVNAGGAGDKRNYKNYPLIEEAKKLNLPITFIGTDESFNKESFIGTNYVNKIKLITSLGLIANSKYFIGFPSMLTYFALWTKTKCKVFPDHQGDQDLRIHDDWKDYLTYVY